MDIETKVNRDMIERAIGALDALSPNLKFVAFPSGTRVSFFTITAHSVGSFEVLRALHRDTASTFQAACSKPPSRSPWAACRNQSPATFSALRIKKRSSS